MQTNDVITRDEMQSYLEMFGRYAAVAYQNMTDEAIKREYDRLKQSETK